MKSYASIDRIEDDFAVCEVELIPVGESNPEDFATKDCEMMDVSLQEISGNLLEVDEGDILVVEHDGENVISIYGKDEEEKARRLEVLRSIIS